MFTVDILCVYVSLIMVACVYSAEVHFKARLRILSFMLQCL